MDYQWNPPYDTMNLNGDWEMENSNVPHITSWLNEQEGELDKFGLSIGNIGALLTYGTATFLANSTTTEGQASVLLNNQDFMSGSIGTTVQLERIKIKIEGNRLADLDLFLTHVSDNGTQTVMHLLDNPNTSGSVHNLEYSDWATSTDLNDGPALAVNGKLFNSEFAGINPTEGSWKLEARSWKQDARS